MHTDVDTGEGEALGTFYRNEWCRVHQLQA